MSFFSGLNQILMVFSNLALQSWLPSESSIRKSKNVSSSVFIISVKVQSHVEQLVVVVVVVVVVVGAVGF